MHKYRFANVICFLFLSSISFAQTSGFDVPANHPRLWWSTEKLNLAKTWYTTHPFTPSQNDPFGNAFRYVLTKETAYARKAINWLLNLELPAGQVLPTAIGCNECRWEGENAILVFDWCYDQMTSAERTIIINRWNKYLSDVNKQEWGGIGMDANNYYWGNLRNSLEWGVASFNHNSEAQSFLNNALITRWKNSFIPYASSGGGKGGAFGEGPEYGSSMISYPLIPFISLSDYGRKILNETSFYREALINLIYSTTPSPIIKGTQSFYGLFPYNETAINDLLHERTYYGDFAKTLANEWKDIPLGQYARHWISICNPQTSAFVESVNKPGTLKNFQDLPTAYYASGLGILYDRSNWTTNATAFQAQLKDATHVGHAHLDWGSFQLFRQGRWLTRESAGYSKDITGVNSNVVQSEYPDAHNTIFVGLPGSMRSLVGYWQTSPPTVTRLETNPNYTYAAVDLTDCFQSEEKPEHFENPFVEEVVREYIFIGKLETLIIFDRIRSKSKQVPAANVLKTALFHFETNPVIENANHVTVTVGNQVARLTTLVPAAPVYQVMNEGSNGQYRLHVSTSGQAQSYLINVLQARGATGENLNASVIENSTSFNVTLTHSTLGNVVINLEKGATSTGGSFGYSSTGIPSVLAPLTNDVAVVSVSDNGPRWGTLVTDVDQDEETAELLTLYPNPASSIITAFIQLPPTQSSQYLSVSVFNSKGQEVQKLTDGYAVTNSQQIQWNTQGLPEGIYLLRLKTRDKVISRQIVVKK